MRNASIGFVGLGRIGRPMASNLLRHGFPVAVYDISRAAVDVMLSAGATKSLSIAEMAATCDAVVTSLPDSAAVESVFLGGAGLIANAQPGLVLIETSTISMSTSRSVTSRAAPDTMLDAPVAKSYEAAVDGTLTFMVGGAATTLALAQPILHAMGKDIIHCGPNGSGHAMKLVNNLVSICLMALNSDALVLGASLGLSTSTMIDVMSTTGAKNGPLLDTMRPRVLAGLDEPGFRVRLAAKDLDLMLDAARELRLPMPVVKAVRRLFIEAIDQGYGDEDLGSVLKVRERQGGIRVRLSER